MCSRDRKRHLANRMSSESAPQEGVETVVETSVTPTDIELENSSDAPEENESIGKLHKVTFSSGNFVHFFENCDR